MNTITIDDSGGTGANRFKIVVSGDTKPEKSSANGATKDQNDTIYPTDDGYAIQGQLNGGRDAYRYTGARIRMVFEHPERVQFKINDMDWRPSHDFDVRKRGNWPGPADSNSRGGDPDPDERDSRDLHLLEIRDGENELNNYRVTVNKELQHSKIRSATVDPQDSISDNGDGTRTAIGQVSAGVDALRYGGQRTEFKAGDPDRLEARVNGGQWQSASKFGAVAFDPGENSTAPKDQEPRPGAEGAPDKNDLTEYRDKGWSVVTLADHVDTDANEDAAPIVRNLIDKHGEKTAFDLGSDNLFLANSAVVNREIDDIAFVGDPDDKPRFIVHDPIGDLFSFRRGSSGYVVEHVDIGLGADGAGATCIRAFVEKDGARIEDVEIHGQIETNGDGITCAIAEDAELLVKDFAMPDGASRTWGVDSTEDSVGIILSGESDGTLRVIDPEIGSCPNNGLYGSGCRKHDNDGRVVVKGGVFRNCDRDGVRVGNDSVIDGTEIVATEWYDGCDNQRGIWFRYSRGAKAKNVTIHCALDERASGIRVDSTCGQVFVSNADVRMDTEARALLAYSPSGEAGGGQVDVDVDGLRVRGDTGAFKESVLVKDRPDSELEDLDIKRGGNGVRFIGAKGSVRDSSVTVDGEAFQNCDVA